MEIRSRGWLGGESACGATVARRGGFNASHRHSLFSGLTQFALAQDGSLAFVPTVAQALDTRLEWVSRDGATVPAAPTLAAYQHPRLSAAGARAAESVTDRAGVERIWVLDLARGARTRLTVEGTVNRWPAWAPDDERLVFCSTQGRRDDGIVREALGFDA